MSHFFTVVLVPDDVSEDRIEDAVAALLAPFDENLRAEPRKQYLDEEDRKHMYAYYEKEPSITPATLEGMIEEYFGYSDTGQDEQGMYYMTTYNEKSQWDWWVIGGRWNGLIRNARRDDADGGFNFGAEFHTLAENCVATKELDHKVEPFAIVTPDGAWHERGNMGWFGCVSDEKEEALWDEEATKILQEHRATWAVGCDLHI